MFQIENLTPFASKLALFPDENGIDTLYVIVKASFKIGQAWTLTDQQPAPVEADVFWGDPENSSLHYASDYHIGKPNTDIIMNGFCITQENKPVEQQIVELKVGSIKKVIKVFGDRLWTDGQISRPEPFQSMPLIYEKAFGGSHRIDGNIDSTELRNPIGLGYAGKRSVSEMNGVKLPNLEDPGQLITQVTDTPAPACFGYVSPAWSPRSAYVGTYDDNWKKHRAPYLPDDYDPRFLNMAHTDLIYPGYLTGGEAVSISGMHPKGALNFSLPVIQLTPAFYIGNEIKTAKFNFETLILEPNDLQLSMVWRAALSCDKKALKINKVQLTLKH